MRNLMHVIYESVIIKRFCPFMAFLFRNTATTMCQDILSEGFRGTTTCMFPGGGWAGGGVVVFEGGQALYVK